MEEEGRNTSEAWGLPISNVDTFSNLTDSQFLVRVLGPKHMGYEVSFIYCLLAQSCCHRVGKIFTKLCLAFGLCGSRMQYILCIGMNEVSDEELECCD